VKGSVRAKSLRVPGDDLELHIAVDVARQVVHLAVDFDSHGVTRQAFAYAGGNLGTGGGSVKLPDGTVG